MQIRTRVQTYNTGEEIRQAAGVVLKQLQRHTVRPAARACHWSVCVCVCVCARAHMHVCVCIRAVCIVCVCVHIHVHCVSIQTYVCKNTYVCVMQTYTHIYMRRFGS